MEKARFRIHDVLKCGYYHRGDQNPVFGSLDQLLPNLHNWINQPTRTLKQTCTYKAANPDGPLRTFCLGVHNCGGDDYLVITWNETPSQEGVVSSIDVTKQIANTVIEDAKIPDGYVPGYATYFFIKPSSKKYATIQFKNQLTGNQNLILYLDAFLRFHSRFCSQNQNGDIWDIDGYHNGDRVLLEVLPRFDSSLFKRGGKLDFIINNSSSISKVISKTEINIDNVEKLAFFQKFLISVGVSETHTSYKSKYLFRSEVDYRPTKDDLEKMIMNWRERNASKDEDLGVKLTGNQEIYWLSHTIESFERELDVKRDNTQIINTISLVNWLKSNKATLSM